MSDTNLHGNNVRNGKNIMTPILDIFLWDNSL
jgi:hypothetical protein